MDRVPDFESVGSGFESLRGRRNTLNVVESTLINAIYTVKRVCSKQALFCWYLWVRMGTYISIVFSSSNAEILENSIAIGVRSSISFVASSLEDGM